LPVTERIIDQWAGLNHKPVMQGRSTTAPEPPSWIPRLDRRRLTAYIVLAAYRLNAAKEFVDIDTSADADRADLQRLARREYGDADLFIRQTAAAIVGRGATLTVIGAEAPPEEPPETAGELVKAEFQRVKATYPQLVERQQQLDEWAEAEQWPLRVNNAEETAQGIGDAVYWLTFSTRRKRVKLRTLDPGFYFPVYPAGGDTDDYPDKVHLCWEYEEDPTEGGFGNLHGEPVRWLRRITYELVPTFESYTPAYASEPAEKTCLMTDARWNLSVTSGTVHDLSIDRAIFNANEDGEEIRDLDLGIDFIPVVHLPNMDGDPWGTSLLMAIAQIIDDLQIADTDASSAASIAGAPPIAVAGTTGSSDLRYGHGMVWQLPNGGGASVLDTSKGLESLHTHQDRLFKRASTNARVPEEVLGRVGANEVPSGTALSLSFGPFEIMVEQARLVRKFKYQLLLKMVQRLHIAAGAWQGEVHPAEVRFGSALPADFSTLADLLLKLTGSKALLGRSTAVNMLRAAGMPIDNVNVEADGIKHEDFDGANMVYRATRSPALAAEYLGLELPEDVLMEQLSKVLKREVSLDEVRDLFDQKKEAENAQKVLDAEEASKRMESAKVSGQPAGNGRNAPSRGGGNGGRTTPAQ
jgi:hypothetical protein